MSPHFLQGHFLQGSVLSETVLGGLTSNYVSSSC